MKLCPSCRVNKAESHHHLVPREFGGGDNSENIIKLCEKCHNIIEVKTYELFESNKYYSSEQLRNFICNGYFPTQVLTNDDCKEFTNTTKIIKLKSHYKLTLPKLVIHEGDNGSLSVSIRHGGNSARMFLLDSNNKLIKIVKIEEYPEIYNNPQTALVGKKFKRCKGKNQYLSSKATITGISKDELIELIKTNYKYITKFFGEWRFKH